MNEVKLWAMAMVLIPAMTLPLAAFLSWWHGRKQARGVVREEPTQAHEVGGYARGAEGSASAGGGER